MKKLITILAVLLISAVSAFSQTQNPRLVLSGYSVKDANGEKIALRDLEPYLGDFHKVSPSGKESSRSLYDSYYTARNICLMASPAAVVIGGCLTAVCADAYNKKDSKAKGSGMIGMVAGGTIVLAGVAAHFISLGQMHKIINEYNRQNGTEVALSMGATSDGIGLVLTF